MQDTFFETAKDRALASVSSALRGDGLLVPLTLVQRELLREIQYHVGLPRAIRGEDLCRRLRVGEKELRNIVGDLRRTHLLLICSSQSSDGGYFLAENDQEILDFFRAYIKQPLTMLRLAKTLAPAHLRAELMGQMQMELAQEDAVNDTK